MQTPVAREGYLNSNRRFLKIAFIGILFFGQDNLLNMNLIVVNYGEWNDCQNMGINPLLCDY